LMYLLLLIRDLSLKTLNFLCFWVPWNEGFSDLRTCQDWALAAKDPSSLSHFFFLATTEDYLKFRDRGTSSTCTEGWGGPWHRSSQISLPFPPNFDEMRKGIHTHTHTHKNGTIKGVFYIRGTRTPNWSYIGFINRIRPTCRQIYIDTHFRTNGLTN
jgi:hypothetical protein